MATVREALNSLLRVCDGAKRLDEHGFNAPDSPVARKCAFMPTWTRKREVRIKDMLLKYKVQLSRYGIDFDSLEFETKETDVNPHEDVDAEFGTKPFVVIFEGKLALISQFDFKDTAKSIPGHYWDPRMKCWMYSVRKETLLAFESFINDGTILSGDSRIEVMIKDAKEGKFDTPVTSAQQPERAVLTFSAGVLVLKSPFTFKEKAKAIPFHKWDTEKKCWTYPLKNEVFLAFAPLVKAGEVEVTEEIKDMIEKAKPQKTTLTLEDGILVLRSPYSFRDSAKTIPNYKWDNDRKCWVYPAGAKELLAFETFIKAGEVEADSKILDMIEAVYAMKAQKEVAKMVKDGDVPEIPVPLKTKPYRHQKVAYAYAMMLNAAGLFMEQGTGKTLVAIAVAGKRYLNGEVKRVLVVAPLGVVPVWPKQFKTHADFPVNAVPLFASTMDKRIELLKDMVLEDELQVAVVNYDALRNPKMLNAIIEWGPDMAILDESHKIKDRESQQAKACYTLRPYTKYRLALTGTPVTQGEWDVFGQYLFLDTSVFGTNFYAFRNEWFLMGGYENKEIVGLKDKLGFHEKMYSIAYRVTKDECLDLPPQVDEELYCILKESRQYYDVIQSDLQRLFEEGGKNQMCVLTELLRMHQCTGGFYKPYGKEEIEHVGHEKLNLLKDLLSDMPKDKKLVIFTVFRPEIAAIEKLVKETGRTVKTFFGDTPAKERGPLVDEFQFQPDPAVLIVQIQTGGMGIDLYAADTAIFYSMDYSYGNYAQAKARIHRSGTSADKVTFIHLLAKDTIDETIYHAVQHKQKIADIMVDRLRWGIDLDGEITDEEGDKHPDNGEPSDCVDAE